MAEAASSPDLVVERASGAWTYYRRDPKGYKPGMFFLLGVYWETGQVGGISTAFITDEVKPYVRIVYMKGTR
jgi:hypothetical protein